MSYDVTIIGGGIVGLATAMHLLEQRPGLRLCLVEKEAHLAAHQTGNNSGVIHSGLYYRPGSLKARNCVRGYQLLLDFLRRHDIPHEICGKVVVATRESELGPLEELHRRGTANGLEGLRWLSPEEIREIEPHCAGIRGLYVPQTGIVDYRTVAETYGREIQRLGGEIHLDEEARGIRQSTDAVEVVTTRATRRSRLLVTCAGLHSDRLARHTHPRLDIRITPFRGEYYVLRPEARGLVRNLIYPVPDPAFPFLGVHFTRMIGGAVECGPNAVFAFAREGYRKTDFSFRDTWDALAWPGFRKVARKYWKTGLGEFHRSFSKAAFVKALQRLIPEIQEEHLLPGGAGIRAQACGIDGRLLDDFHIIEDGNVVHVCNAPSPAATASLAIGETIARTVASALAPSRQQHVLS
ncbi:MAG: L-2-hydroxyglutarate oxidase [Verrucomicrobia bacterium]|nr:MAG: L-2-hydroxyglutarate oxidase [Verrucomicrobiota bacterium]